MRPRIDSRSGASLRTRCSQAVLDFLCTTNAGRLLFPNSAEEDDQSETSEWEHRERQEREEERRLEAEEAGAEVEERLRFFPTPSVMASEMWKSGGSGGGFICPVFPLWAEGKGELQRATCGLIEVGVGRADSVYIAMFT